MSYRETRGRRCGRIALLLACAAPLALALPGAAMAQDESAARNFSIPVGPLSAALQAYSAQTGIQLVYSSSLVDGITSAGVSGRMSAAEALGRLLAGTGLGGSLSGNTATIGGASADGERVTGVVSVEGVQGSPYFGGAGQTAGVNGVNGSRDITATEGTGSFTSGALTIGSKVPQALKDVPQSISVLTSERLEQQNVTDFTTAMAQLPGISLAQGATSLETTFYSRGFEVTSIQIDGGAPLSTSFAIGQGFYPQIDMAIYDHVELLRGAAGQFGSYGNPGGTVNLVRKKPFDHAQVSIEAQAGSWQNYRVVADASSPLALDGKLRGRLVMTYQDNRHFYDTARDNKTLIYGIAEFDATPRTLVTGGISYARQDSVPWYGGLPRYLNGDDLELPRSTSFVFPWNRWDFDTTEIFGSVEQKLGDEWTLKFNATHNRQSSARKIGYSTGAVNPTNHLGPVLGGTYNDYSGRQFSAEATLAGAFEIFGQRQEVTFGVNRVRSDGAGLTSYASLIGGSPATPYQPYPGAPIYCRGATPPCPVGSIRLSGPPIDVFDFDPLDLLYTEPRNPLPVQRFSEFATVQTGAYLNLRLTAFDRLHLTTGLRWSRYQFDANYESFCTTTTGSCVDLQIGDSYGSSRSTYGASDLSWPPPVSLSFEITKALTAYVGYTDIYESQAYYVDTDLNPLPPITGGNWEGGLKWAPSDGKLNLALSFYRVRRKGFGFVDPPDYSGYQDLGGGVSCCFIASPDAAQRSKGIDVEATGEIVRGWQVSANYTYSENQQEGFGFGDGIPIVTITPKHLYKVWTSYDFGAAGHTGALSALAVSLGVNGQSSGFNEGTTCVRLDETATPNPVTGAQSCLPDGYEVYRFTVPAYAVFSGRIDYRFSEKWSLAVNLENIFNKTYYQTSGSVSSGNWYGTPRSFTASLRAKW
ncbi:MAG: TonB-dependent receptor [Candidatus Andeanibacterium colombiense]|uniref:TonB-dependent receptor n=1 Tax=Candidatus Andeanibacterium colombiense TaxID=3121345 RepID=A0AAJ5X5X7_9SPHN|nr:MAG: TonB-dependent receptor [Sphingomonadaceae bacterium]